MIVLGYVLQDASSPKQKFHSAFAVGGNARCVVNYGPSDTDGTTRADQMWVRPAAEKVTSIMEQKEKKGYDTTIVPLVTVEVPDDTPDAGLRRAVTQNYRDGHATEYTMPSAAVEQFVAAVSHSTPAHDTVTADSGRVVDDRAPALRLADGEVLIRPNGETYLPRDLGGHTDAAALRAMRDADLYVLLAGAPGTGKTALADATFPELIMVQCHGDMTVASLVGTHLPTPDGGWRWHDGPLTRGMREGKPVCFDEIHKMPDEVSSVLHSAMDGRKTVHIDDRPDADPVVAADGFYVLAAYNPDSLGGKGLTEAMLSRFTVQIDVTTDYDAARALGVPADFVRIAENLATKATEDRAIGGRGVWAPQMRELLAAKNLIDAGLGDTFAAGSMVAQCPWPEDLPTVLEVTKQALGTDVQPLRLGAQV